MNRCRWCGEAIEDDNGEYCCEFHQRQDKVFGQVKAKLQENDGNKCLCHAFIGDNDNCPTHGKEALHV